MEPFSECSAFSAAWRLVGLLWPCIFSSSERVTPTHRQGGALLLKYDPVRVTGLGRTWRILLNGVEKPEFPLLATGRGEEAAVEALSRDEVLEDGRLPGSCVSCSPAGSILLLER